MEKAVSLDYKEPVSAWFWDVLSLVPLKQLLFSLLIISTCMVQKLCLREFGWESGKAAPEQGHWESPSCTKRSDMLGLDPSPPGRHWVLGPSVFCFWGLL